MKGFIVFDNNDELCSFFVKKNIANDVYGLFEKLFKKTSFGHQYHLTEMSGSFSHLKGLLDSSVSYKGATVQLMVPRSSADRIKILLKRMKFYAQQNEENLDVLLEWRN